MYYFYLLLRIDIRDQSEPNKNRVQTILTEDNGMFLESKGKQEWKGRFARI